MLTPDKYMDLDKSLLSSIGILLKYLIRKKVSKLDDLRRYLEDRIGENIEGKFLYSLSILYVTGKIEYLDKNDTIVLIKNEVK